MIVSRTKEECKLSIEGEDIEDVKLGLQQKWWVQ